MTWIAGADGCPSGWFRACRETVTGELRFEVVETAVELVARTPNPEIVALDIPIGLPEAGSRACDLAARKCLGARRNSVFPAPVRAALSASSREEASEITARIDGRRVAAQAWAIYPKIREVDQTLATNTTARAAIREVHPEVCFWAWNDKQPMEWAKKKQLGRDERVALAEAWLGADILARARRTYLKKQVADDDILDAISGLRTAHRIADLSSETLPVSALRDSTGLRMEIVY